MKLFFHYVSYIQYPLMLIGLYFAYKPIIFGFETMWDDYNTLLVLMGLGVSFSTLQDTTKTQNKLSKRIWENPRYSKIFLALLAATILLVFFFGLFGFFASQNEHLKTLSFGLISFGISLVGLLKAAMEMAENHQKK